MKIIRGYDHSHSTVTTAQHEPRASVPTTSAVAGSRRAPIPTPYDWSR